MPDPITEIFLAYLPSLTAYLRGSFPKSCAALATDAACDAYLVALERPALFQRALARGADDVRRLFRSIAWRRLRAMLCRGARRFEQGAADEELEAHAVPPGQEHAAGYEARVVWLFEAAAAEYGCGRDEQLRDALVEKVLTGDSDRDIAARHEIPREYLNRAKRFVQRGVWEAALCA